MRRGIVAGLLAVSALLPGLALAAGAISQAFSTGGTAVTAGMLVSYAPTGSNAVRPATTGSNSGLVGVITQAPLVQLSSNSSQTAQVAVAGLTNVLVSNINGPIQIGDKIAPSPIPGVGMKALTAGEIIGAAEEPLTSVKTVSQTVTDLNGKSSQVNIGLVPVAMHIEYYTGPVNGTVSTYVPQFLQDIANAFTGRSVSPWRVLGSSLALLLGFAMVSIMLTTGIRSGIISIGRNPLARGALLTGLLDIIIAALGVLAVTFAAVYALIML